MLFQPTSPKRRTIGLVFLNFVSPAAASAFVDRWQGRKLVHETDAKPLDIVAAHVQGYEGALGMLRPAALRVAQQSRARPPLLFSDTGEPKDMIEEMRLHFGEEFDGLLEAAWQRRAAQRVDLTLNRSQ